MRYGISRIALAVFVFASITSAYAADGICTQVIQPAINDSTNECKEFPTPCDVPSGWTLTDSCANKTDNQLLDMENASGAKELSGSFNLQKFSSCEDMGTKIKKFLEDYSTYNEGALYRGGYPVLLEDAVTSDIAGSAEKTISSTTAPQANSTTTDTKATTFSETNVQVAGVDESEIVKTDGKYIYYFNSKKHSIDIVKAYPAENMELVKVINVPASFSNPEIYVNGTDLIIVSTKYTQGNFSYWWFERNAKTVVVNYDISDLSSLKIKKFLQVDGSLMQTRRIGKYIYMISQSNLSFPYVNYYGPAAKVGVANLDNQKLQNDFDLKKLLPKKAELRIAKTDAESNIRIKGQDLKYNLSQGYTSKCVDIDFVLPDAETMKKFSFTPSYVTISAINIEDPKEETKTKLLFGDVNDIYMSLDNLYVTSRLYSNYDFKCPVIQCIKAPCPTMPCYFPYYRSGENTLVHKINVNGTNMKYAGSTIVPGSPLTQYSMDESSSGSYRIVTTTFYPNRETNLYVFDKNLKLSGKLEGLGENENFQASRFIGDRLYLVTFKQIDPLFVIDLKDDTKPNVLGELKMPGYSTYLHPYDENHLIGIGYDTKENQWGGTVNSGLKVDLYDISDLSNPKQMYTKKFGDSGSYSEALTNPRLFVWDAGNNMLYISAMLYTNANDTSNPYRNSGAFQGALAINIDTNSGISELKRVTHISTGDLEQERQKECKAYAEVKQPACQKIIGGMEYCPPSTTYVPEYCFESSTVGEYFASKIWQYGDLFINRNVFLDGFWYTISNSIIKANTNTGSFNEISSVNLK